MGTGLALTVPKFCLDTNVVIDALRDVGERVALQRFLSWALPSTYFSAVVVQELETGARSPAQAEGLDELLIDPFERRGRIFPPSAAAWRATGRALGATGRHSGWSAAGPPRSLVNDLLLGFSCREQGIRLVTRDADFHRIAGTVRGLELVAPWPRPPRSRTV